MATTQPLPHDSSTAIKNAPKQRTSTTPGNRRLGRARRGFPFGVLVLATLWMIFDPNAQRAFESLIGFGKTGAREDLSRFSQTAGGLTAVTLLTAGVLAVAGLVHGVLARWMWRSKPTTLRELIGNVALSALICGFVTQYPAIAWVGQKHRSRQLVVQMEGLANELHRHWPTSDGEIDSIGPFTAYPNHRPTVLLLLSPYPLEGTETVVAAIEKSADGTIRFQLGGEDSGVWLQWHGNRTKPKPHTNGLSESRRLERFARLGDRWYVVRYEEQ